MKLKTCILAVLLLFVSNLIYGQKIYDLSKYGLKPDSKKNASPVLVKLIDKIKKETKKDDLVIIKFEKGEYNFYEKGSFIKEYYISNHDQINPKKVGIALEDFENITLDGNGATFIFHGRMLPISLLKSTNCTLKNFNIDFKTPHITQVKIIENTPDNGIVFEPAEWVNYRINKDTYFEAYGEGWSMAQNFGIAFEGDTKRLVYNSSDISFNTKNCKEISSRKIHAPNWKDERLIPGTIVVMRSGARPTPGIFISHCVNTNLNNINVHYAEGMGLLAQLSENINLEKFKVALKGDNDPRYFTTQADATHFSGCKGKIISCNGLYEGMMDDAINVHGTYLKVIKRIDNKTLIAKYMHYQAWGFEWGRNGEKVQFIKSNTMEIIGNENEIVTIEPYDKNKIDGAKEFKITFKDTIDEQISEKEGFGIENLSWTPEVYFANNTIRNNRARGTLFSTPKLTVIENNLFDHTSGTAILLCGDCNGWYETGACRNVIIRKNRFKNALTSMFQFTNAVISIYPEIPNLEGQKKFFHGGKDGGIIIEENIFETFDAPILYAKSVDGLIFRKNIIIQNNDYKPFHFIKSRFFFEKVTNVSIDE